MVGNHHFCSFLSMCIEIYQYATELWQISHFYLLDREMIVLNIYSQTAFDIIISEVTFILLCHLLLAGQFVWSQSLFSDKFKEYLCNGAHQEWRPSITGLIFLLTLHHLLVLPSTTHLLSTFPMHLFTFFKNIWNQPTIQINHPPLHLHFTNLVNPKSSPMG